MPIKFKAKQKQRLRRLGVTTVYIFGSQAAGLARPNSDFDFAVLVKQTKHVKPGVDTLPLYHALYDVFTDVIPKKSAGAVVDIVFLQGGVSLELQANVVRYGKIIFEEHPQQRADYEAQVMVRMADIRPLLDMMDEAILARI